MGRVRVGVFVCHCGSNIGGVVRVPEVVDYARTLPDVHYAEDNLYTCSDAGLTASNRTRADFTVVPEIIVATGRTDEEFETSVDAARRLLSFYGSTPAYRPVLELHGYGDLQTELNLLSKQGRWSEMAGLIDDELLELIAAHGSPRDVAATIRARSHDIATDVAIYQPFPLADETLAEIMEGLAE